MIVNQLPNYLQRKELESYIDLKPHQVVNQFEEIIANFFGSKYCVLTDCCTHALELSLRLHRPSKPVQLTQWTYMSVGMMLDKIGINYYLNDIKWQNYYNITNKVIDAAAYWKENCYIENSLFCISFQYQKHCPIGRGGAILLNNPKDYELLQKQVYDGRDRNLNQLDDNVEILGYHYHMTPEDAARGIELFNFVKNIPAAEKSWKDYKNLKEYKYFNNH